MNKLQQFWFDQMVADIQNELHNRDYTVGYSKHIGEIALDSIKQSHRQARARSNLRYPILIIALIGVRWSRH